MRVITQQSFGGPEVLEIAEADRPVPGPGEVLVRVEAIGLNPVDAFVRSGAFPLLGQPPFVLGWDLAGVVEAVGPGIHPFATGDRVAGMPAFPRAASTYAEYVTAPARELVAVPPGLDLTAAAGLPLAGLTAWQALVGAARLEAGQRVLVHAAGGGVGHLAVQIAVARGAHVVGTASAAKAGFVKDLGADTVVDYRAGDLAELLREQAGDIDVVLDTVGGAAAEASLPVLRRDGVLATIVRHSDAGLRATVEGAGRRFAGVTVEPDGAALAELVQLATTGRLHVHVERTFALEQVAQAHRLLEASPQQGSGTGITGKLVLTV